MIRFISVSLKNFLSYGANTTIIDLQREGTTLIVGEDRDNTSNGTGANGTGKTSIVQALIFAVYGKTLQNISLPNLVNNVNKKNMEVTVTFEKDDIFYHIKRVRKGKGGNYMKFFVRQGSADFTDDDELTRDSVAHTNEEIEKVIGMPFDLFCRIVVFSATHMPFLDLPLPQQTKFIEELFALTILSEKADLLKDRSKDSERSMEIARNKYALLVDEHERHQNQIKNAQERVDTWKLTQDTKIIGLQNGIKQLSVIDVEKELKAHQDISDTRAKLKELQTEYEQTISQLNDAKHRENNWEIEKNAKVTSIRRKLEKVEGVDVEEQQKLQSQLVDIQRELDAVEGEIDQIGSVINTLDDKMDKKSKELEHLQSGHCPYCLQEYKDSEQKRREVNASIENMILQLDQLHEAKEELELERKDLNFKHREVQLQIKIGNINELMDIKSQQSQLEQSLDELANTPNPFTDLLLKFDDNDILKKEVAIKELIAKEKKISSGVSRDLAETMQIRDNLILYQQQLNEAEQAENPHLAVLQELVETELEDINTTEIDDLDKLIRHQKFLRNLLTKKDSFIRKTLLDKNIGFLNARLQSYLSELALPHTVEFTHDLTANISKFGKTLDFGNLSHGQQARINICLSLAFRDLLESLHTPINVFMLDEVLDEGLDAIGVEAAAKVIKRKTRDEHLSSFIISHKNEIDRRFDRIMTVSMEDEFSFINEG